MKRKMEPRVGWRWVGAVRISVLIGAVVLLAGIITAVAFHTREWRGSDRRPAVTGLLETASAHADFGRFGPQQHPVVRFAVANGATSTLAVEHLIPSCGCIAATCSPRNLAPGASATIAVTYRGLPGAFGPFGRSVSVVYRIGHSRTERTLQLFVRGDAVWDTPIVVYPQTICFGAVPAGGDFRSRLYFHGWSGLLRSLPAAIVISPDHDSRVLLRPVNGSRATRDRSVQIMLQVPILHPAGAFRRRISLTGPAFGTVWVWAVGRISTGTTATAGGSRHGPLNGADSAPAGRAR